MGAVKASPSEVMLAVGEGDVDVNNTENRLGADPGHVFSEEVLQLVNAERRKTGVFSHPGSDGSSVGVRVSREGYSWRAVAENIAKGQRDAQAVVRAWMRSAGHRRNILN